MKSIIDDFRGYFKYDKLTEVLRLLKEDDKLDVLSVYLGDINGIYDVNVGDDDNSVFDCVITDGINHGICLTKLSNSGVGYNIEFARFVMIITIDKDKGNYLKADLFFDKTSIYDFINFMNLNDCRYFNVNEVSNLLKNYVCEPTEKNLSVTPSMSLIEKNSRDIKKRSRSIR